MGDRKYSPDSHGVFKSYWTRGHLPTEECVDVDGAASSFGGNAKWALMGPKLLLVIGCVKLGN